MKTTIGGDRLGSGNKQNVSMRNYERSTHDLSYLWRSSMSAGTLVPFMSIVGLPGDSFDINLNCEVLTLPTIGPLFGSYKVQLDVFQVPIRLYNAKLHMNRLGIGMDMSKILLPKTVIASNLNNTEGWNPLDDNAQINPSSLFKYLGISGIGTPNDDSLPRSRKFNGVPLLAYWDIYKNYYSNKQEERGFYIHWTGDTPEQEIQSAILTIDDVPIGNILENEISTGTHTPPTEVKLVLQYPVGAAEPNHLNPTMTIDGGSPVPIYTIIAGYQWSPVNHTLTYIAQVDLTVAEDWEVQPQASQPDIPIFNPIPNVVEFPLANIDDMRDRILQFSGEGDFIIDSGEFPGYGAPYSTHIEPVAIDDSIYMPIQFSQEGLGLKTYQSDLFNNWISTEWIDGPNGVNAVTAVDTTGDSFTMDALNLAQKVYVMLNRIAISGGTYDDWLDAVYTHERSKGVESPVYMGSLIKELAFEEVISNSAADDEPLGTLAGRGRLTNKNKGGHIKVKIDEPSYIMGIVSLTPRIDYSQGNNWDVNLNTLNDLHKPALDAIGYQDLITEQMAWQSTELEYEMGQTFPVAITTKSAGKQPAWINYMTAVNKTYGNFAIQSKEMFMTLNRRYEIDEVTGDILDLTTYIDPTKFNHIFADTNLDAQNFWVQISNNITARRKMSAKVIPNL